MHSTLAARHLVDETHVYIVQTGGNPVIAQGEGSNQPLVTDLNQLSVALPCKVADRPCEFVLHKMKNETHNKSLTSLTACIRGVIPVSST